MGISENVTVLYNLAYHVYHGSLPLPDITRFDSFHAVICMQTNGI